MLGKWKMRIAIQGSSSKLRYTGYPKAKCVFLNFSSGKRCLNLYPHYDYHLIRRIDFLHWNQLLSYTMLKFASFAQKRWIWTSFDVYIHTLRPVNDATEGSMQEAHMGASCVLPRKVGKMVWVCVQFSFEENDGCFLLCP